MLTEPEDLRSETVLRLVREHWDERAHSAANVSWGAGAHHWVCGGWRAARWVLTADDVSSPGRLEELEAAYAVARRLAADGLHFVVPTIAPRAGPTPGGDIGIRRGRHLLTVTAYLEGEPGTGTFADDSQRTLVAREIGALHGAPVPDGAPRWRPGPPGRADLERLLGTVDGPAWTAGPFGEPVREALREARPHLLSLSARFDVLADRALDGSDGWVLTHGEPHTANVLWGPAGPVLVDWESLRVAPRERDLRTVLRGAEGAEPLSAYVASGGTVDLDADMVELFDLEWWLRETALLALRFSGPHEGDAEDVRLHEAFRDEVVPSVRSARGNGGRL